MSWKTIRFVLLLLIVPSAFAQTTSVSGTITDSGAVVWKNGTYSFTFTPSPSNPTATYFQGGVVFNKNTTISGSLDNTGSLTSIAVPDNLTITPSGNTWAFQVCPAATASNGCFKIQLTITGASQSITSAVVPPPVVVNVVNPGFYAAYTDGEIGGARLGSFYFNLTDSTSHVCSVPTCTWLSLTSATSFLAANNAFTGLNTASQVWAFNGGLTSTTGTFTGALNANGGGALNGTFTGPTTLPGVLNATGGGSLGGAFSGVPSFTIANSPSGATESGSTVTITTTATCSFATGQFVNISGVGVAGYNGTFAILSPGCNGTSSFTYTNFNTALAASGGGSAAGGPTLNGAVTIPNAVITNAATLNSLNHIVYADQQAGATPDIQLTNCLAAATFGTCNAFGYGATTQILANPVTIPAGQTVLFDVNTKWQVAGASQAALHVNHNATVDGFHFDCGNQASYTGNVMDFPDSAGYHDGNTTIAKNTYVTCNGVTGGTAFLLSSASPTASISFITLEHTRIFGLQNGILFTVTGNGFVNGNHITDYLADNTKFGLHFTNNNGQLNGNVCSPCSYEATIAGNGVNGILYDGTSGANDTANSNQYYGDIWDVPTNSVSYTNTKAISNLVVGLLNGSVNDPSNANLAISPSGLFVGETLTMNTTILANGGIIPVNIQPNSGKILISKTAPTIAAAGCGGAAASIPSNNGTGAFTINVGTTPGSACTFTLPSIDTDWVCNGSDLTTASTSVFLQKQTGALSASSATITNFNTAGAATAFVASDVLRMSCHGN